jgi:hypothetical protein
MAVADSDCYTDHGTRARKNRCRLYTNPVDSALGGSWWIEGALRTGRCVRATAGQIEYVPLRCICPDKCLGSGILANPDQLHVQSRTEPRTEPTAQLNCGAATESMVPVVPGKTSAEILRIFRMRQAFL